MVNVKNLFGMAVVATALVGCSSSDDLATDVKGNESKTEAAYASFKINLPTTTGTRAAGDPTFDEGTAAEYEVKNGTILIFDNSGNFVESADLGTMNPWTKDTDPNGVTTAAAVTVKLSKAAVGGNYQALVLLNNNTNTTEQKVTLPNDGDSYTTWSATVGNANPDNYEKTDGIFMANAPKYVSNTENPTTLVAFNNVYASREQAQANPATTVYVERGLAKVTMDNFATDYPISGGTYDGDKVVIKNWQLDVTNKSTFPIHQANLKSEWSDIWTTSRFYDNTSSAFKRVYWGIDPNYSLGLTDLDKCKASFFIANKDGKKYSDGTTNVAWTASGTSQYCLENTFDINNMKQGQTTRVIFKATYTPKALLGESDKTFFMIGNNPNIWTKTTLIQQITNKAKVLHANVASVDFKSDAALLKAGSHNLTADDITIKDASDNAITTINFVDLNSKLGLVNGLLINTYAGGECYYIARIKHFNELTPWGAGQPTYGVINDTNNDSYLGRYGVLRNNWYELTVNSVSGPGYPDVPEVKPTEPDDENTKFINVEVKILDWAKRSQSIDL